MIYRSALFSSVLAIYKNLSQQLVRRDNELFNKLLIIKIGYDHAKCHADKRLPFWLFDFLRKSLPNTVDKTNRQTANVCRHGVLRRRNRF